MILLNQNNLLLQNDKVLSHDSALQFELEHYYKFDGNSIDFIGTNHGTDFNVTYDSHGLINDCVSFNGINSEIYFSNPINSQCSISFWINPDNFINQQRFIYTNKFYFVFLAGSSGLYIDVNQTGANFVTNLTPNIWTHIVVTNSNGGSIVYINGVPALSHTQINTVGGNLILGSYGGGDYYTGKIDEFSFYNRVLQQQDITQIYNNGIGRQYPFNL